MQKYVVQRLCGLCAGVMRFGLCAGLCAWVVRPGCAPRLCAGGCRQRMWQMYARIYNATQVLTSPFWAFICHKVVDLVLCSLYKPSIFASLVEILAKPSLGGVRGLCASLGVVCCGQKRLCSGLCVCCAPTFPWSPPSRRRSILIGDHYSLLRHTKPFKFYDAARSLSNISSPAYFLLIRTGEVYGVPRWELVAGLCEGLCAGLCAQGRAAQPAQGLCVFFYRIFHNT